MDEQPEETPTGDDFQWPRRRPAAQPRIVEEVLQTQFPQAVRGYDREAVDRYTEQVRAVISELEASASPDAAVTRAIEEITDETRDVLLRAQQSAQEITTRARDRADALSEQTEREAAATLSAARHEADEARDDAHNEATELRQTARREVAELRETASREVEELRATAQREVEELWETAQREVAALRASARQETDQLIAAAENRVRELDDSAERLLAERRRLLDDMESVSRQLGSIVSSEAERFPEPGRADAPADRPPEVRE